MNREIKKKKEKKKKKKKRHFIAQKKNRSLQTCFFSLYSVHIKGTKTTTKMSNKKAKTNTRNHHNSTLGLSVMNSSGLGISKGRGSKYGCKRDTKNFFCVAMHTDKLRCK